MNVWKYVRNLIKDNNDSKQNENDNSDSLENQDMENHQESSQDDQKDDQDYQSDDDTDFQDGESFEDESDLGNQSREDESLDEQDSHDDSESTDSEQQSQSANESNNLDNKETLDEDNSQMDESEESFDKEYEHQDMESDDLRDKDESSSVSDGDFQDGDVSDDESSLDIQSREDESLDEQDSHDDSESTDSEQQSQSSNESNNLDNEETLDEDNSQMDESAESFDEESEQQDMEIEDSHDKDESSSVGDTEFQDEEISEEESDLDNQSREDDTSDEQDSHDDSKSTDSEQQSQSIDESSNLDNDPNDDENLDEDISQMDEGEESFDEEQSLENNERLEKIKNLRDKLLEYALKKEEEEKQKRQLEKSHLESTSDDVEESIEEKYELSEHTNQFLNTLKELPSFKDRDRGPGYAIDTESYSEVSDSIIRTLITKFLNRRFCKKSTDLNVRSNSLEKARGFYRWEVKDVITHLETHQITKVLDDKYGYEYANGRNENVPLSFYFDMSISMSTYSNLLAVIAIELLKKNVKVLIGFNERVNVQIDSIKENVDVLELAKLLETAGYSYYNSGSAKSTLSKNGLFKFKFINQNLDNYLIDKKAEKCVVFSDFDPFTEVCNLSNFAEVYWFCFENEFEREDAELFHGFIYPTQDEDDIAKGLIKVNDNRFEALCFTENPKEFTKRKE